jgi:hypothetical protein
MSRGLPPERPGLVQAIAREVREFAKMGLRDDSAARRHRLLTRASTLRNLPAVRAAGEDSAAQFLYIHQAIVDAIDALESGGDGTHAARHRECLALRELFGLSDQTRTASWRFRQELAAQHLFLSWDHFRHETQEALLQTISEHILRAGTTDPESVLDLEGGDDLQAVANQQELQDATVEYIHRERPRSATLLELSTATIRPILVSLCQVGAQMRILAFNPERLTSTWQIGRFEVGIRQLMLTEFAGYPHVDLAVYNIPPGIRGRHIGGLMSLGWYTYRDNRTMDASNPASMEIWGHDNAMVIGLDRNPGAAVLSSWFDREFERLWDHRLTRRGREARLLLGIGE